jgi:DNA-binding NarL/FixJ family response regulator
MSAGYELVGESTNAEDMVAAVSRTQPDALILDVVMRERPALDALAACMRLKADLAVVVLTARAELRLAREAIGIGALGYVLKDAEPSELLLALRLALRGASYLAPGLVNRLAQDGESSQPRALSQREREVVRLLALGHTFREIAAQMKFSERTVKSDRANVAQVLGISTRAELTCWALQHGLLSGAQAA